MKGGSLFVFKRRQAFQRVTAPRLQLDVLTDDLFNRCAFTDSLNIAFRNPSFAHKAKHYVLKQLRATAY